MTWCKSSSSRCNSVQVIDNFVPRVVAIGCKSSRNGCKWLQVTQGWLQVIDNLVQGVGASYVGAGASH
jgi:hypothetical protein